MSIKAILFDIDGTLVDSNEQHISAWEDAFRQHGYRIERQAIHDQVGKGGDNLLPALICGITPDQIEALDKAHGEAFRRKYRGEVRLFPGARELIQRAHDDGKLIVLASSASHEELQYWRELLDVDDLLAAATSRDNVEHSKPSPDIFRAALDKITPVQPYEAVVIGDTPYDLSAARKNAIPAIGLRSGRFSDEVLAAAHPLAIYDDVAALLADYERSPLTELELTPP
jgi:membrane protein